MRFGCESLSFGSQDERKANDRTPFMLDAYEAEYEEMCKNQNKHAHELDLLRNANRSLSSQVYVSCFHGKMKAND
jgi:hypothetical protein